MLRGAKRDDVIPAGSVTALPHSPNLNPIKQVFAKLKHLLRKAAERSVETTWKRIGSLLDAFPHHECANDGKNLRYGVT